MSPTANVKYLHQPLFRSASLESALPRSLGQLFIFILVVFNSQLFSATVSNPLGIKYFQELHYLILLLFTAIYMQAQATRSHVVKSDFIVLTLVVTILTYSAFSAWIRFGQPVWYGLIEERRSLSFLIYFPLVWAFRARVVSVHKVFNWILIGGSVCAVLGLAVFYGLIPKLQEIEIHQSLREDRLGVGLWYVSLAALVVAHRYRHLSPGVSMRNWSLFLFFIVVLVVVGQTRQVVLSLLLALLIMRGALKQIMIVSPILIVGFFISISAFPWTAALPEKYKTLYGQLVTEEYLTESARAMTISTIKSEVLEGAWFGSGALSLMWKDGFARIYGQNFFLADVGIFGSFFKFGIVAILVYYHYFKLSLKKILMIKEHAYYRLILAAWLQISLLSPVAAPLEYRGFLTGMLLALTIGCYHELASRKREEKGEQEESMPVS